MNPTSGDLLRSLLRNYHDVAVQFAARNRQLIFGPVEVISIEIQVVELRQRNRWPSVERLLDQVRNSFFRHRIVERLPIRREPQPARQRLFYGYRFDGSAPIAGNNLNRSFGYDSLTFNRDRSYVLCVGRNRRPKNEVVGKLFGLSSFHSYPHEQLLSIHQARIDKELAIRRARHILIKLAFGYCRWPSAAHVQTEDIDTLRFLVGHAKKRAICILAHRKPDDRKAGLKNRIAVATVRIDGGDVAFIVRDQQAAVFQPSDAYIPPSFDRRWLLPSFGRCRRYVQPNFGKALDHR